MYEIINWNFDLGQDSFNNIWAKIQSTLETPPIEVAQDRERKRSRSNTPQRSTPPKEVVQVAAQIEAVPQPIVEAPKPIVVEAPKPIVEEILKPAVAPKPVETAPSAPVEQKKASEPVPTASTATAEKKKGGKLLLSF